MPIRDCPFTFFSKDISRPVLPVKIINPHTGKSYRTFGIIDTGADDCAIPARFAGLLGHDLKSGRIKEISTGNGKTRAYVHTTKFEIYHPATGELTYTIDESPIDFLPNLHVVLLGVNSFLSRFILNINYPRKKFSIKRP